MEDRSVNPCTALGHVPDAAVALCPLSGYDRDSAFGGSRLHAFFDAGCHYPPALFGGDTLFPTHFAWAAFFGALLAFDVGRYSTSRLYIHGTVCQLPDQDASRAHAFTAEHSLHHSTQNSRTPVRVDFDPDGVVRGRLSLDRVVGR